MSSKKPLVVVLSRNAATGLSVIRSLGAAGYQVDLVASAYKEGLSLYASSSKYVRNSVEIVAKKVKDSGDSELLDELLKYKGQYDEKLVLFPTDDYTASIMDQSRSVLEDTFIMPEIVEGGEGSLTEHMDKTVQSKLAERAGLLIPKEWIISLREGIEIPEDVIYPCFCKPIESITGYKKEMARCDDHEELRRHLSSLRSKFADRDVLIQEFLEIDYEIDLSGVCLDQEIIIPAIIKKTNVGQYEKGVTLAGKVVPFEEMGAVKENVIEMLKLFRYFGMFDMEFNVVGDKVYFNEVNLRSGGPNYSYYMSGVNLPELFVKEALGEKHSPEEEKVTEYGKSFIYEKVAWNDYIYGFISKKELDACIAAADITLMCNDEDPVPGDLFNRDIKKEAKKVRTKETIKAIKEVIKKYFYQPMKDIVQTILRYPNKVKANRRNPDSKYPRVLVTGRNYSSNLCMARSLGEAGYEVEILRIFQVKPRRRNLMKRIKPDAFSKYIKAYEGFVSKRKPENIVDKLIELADKDRKMLLIPADDLLADIIDDYYTELSKYYLIPNVNETPGEINRLMSKAVQKELAAAAGLPVLNSCVIKTVDGDFTIPKTVNYPCFIKPNISKNSSKSRMRKCDSRKELRAAIKEFSANKDIEMLVEDFVEIRKEYSLLGVSTKAGANGPGFFVAEVGGHNARRGVALTGRILPCTQMQGLIDDMIAFVGSLGFEGLYDIDLIETADGEIYFVELNMRFGASGYAVTKCGVNLPGMYADYMYDNKPIDLHAKVSETDKLFLSEKVLIEEYANNHISKSDVKAFKKNVDIYFIENDDDKRAYRHFRRYFLVAAAMRIVYEIKARKKAREEDTSED